MDEIKQAIGDLYADFNADYYLFNATISDDTADKFISLIRENQKREAECVIILTTYGGDPDAGYRIMRALRRYYKRITLFVFGRCKSTGTLMALAADEIVMSDFSEFGPLDIQLTKDDELANTSGLNIVQSLSSLSDQMFSTFEQNFLALKRKSRNTITTRTAAEICSKLSVGLFSPISGQIDPHKFGETQRAINIAEKYGKRLLRTPQLYDTLLKLILDYPSHGFVIDFDEAKKLFGNVRWVNDKEYVLEQVLFDYVRNEIGEDIIDFLNQIFKNETDEIINFEDAAVEHVTHDAINIETNVQNNETIIEEKQPIFADTPEVIEKAPIKSKNSQSSKLSTLLKNKNNGIAKQND